MTENRTEKNISPKQRKAIESLLTSGSVEAAATTANVSRDTLYRWMKDPTFIAELRLVEAEAVQGLSRCLVGLGEQATKALRDALDEKQPITIRIRAAETVTDRLLKIRELVEIESRLSALENQANEESQK